MRRSHFDFTLLRVLLSCVVISLAGAGQAQDASQSSSEITLERIMAHPDWIGARPERPYWADDGRSIYYFQKRTGEEARDLIQMDLKGNVLRTVADEDRGSVDAPGGRWSADRRHKVYARQGDVYVRDVRSGAVRQLTRTSERETDPRFMIGDSRVSFTRNGSLFVRDLESGLEVQPADLKLEKDPDEKDDKDDYLKDQQQRLIEHVRESEEKKDAARARARAEQSADPTRPPLPWYLGDKVDIQGRSLSPTGRWMILRLAKKQKPPPKRDSMPNYVSDTGYVESRNVRSKVGVGARRAETLVLLDLENHKRHDLDYAALPGIEDDPLKEIREKAEAARETEKEESEDADSSDDSETDSESDEADEDEEKKPKPRPIRVSNVTWSDDGTRVALQCFSLDNKDRWICTVDLEEKKLIALERMNDEAWINRRFTQIGWLKDGETIFFTSERTGYAHLYLRSLDENVSQQLTTGPFEVSNVRLSVDGKSFFYTANAVHPGVDETYRFTIKSGKIAQLTRLGGRNRAILSPNESRMLITHSTATRPPELYVQRARRGADARQLTRTTKPEFDAIAWTEPAVVAIPSRAGIPIYSRVYSPPGGAQESPNAGPNEKRPAVVFVHGAGYLQNSHKGWSSYFREFMFHSLLTRKGYVVLDMDYRASAGYGRDWRTAIYRRMGEPELEDLADGVTWLAENKNVDPARVGVYGGSYGGFLTLMGLFRHPDLFACGAALRPVTDWAHYNHPYTSNILNTPPVDPEAYRRSSPIEYAEGLTKPLLICHGMQDDNVFFQDTVRLVQRLIELKKENWETAIYPVEPHGFRDPTGWLDEYRRIFKLFETHLN